ncbi:MAG: AraC family ligand binding domain-containing protein [Anaerolineales bacterium]|nr:AraC family ligand binding domain-containing protein [Anaerolineales bacterium]
MKTEIHRPAEGIAIIDRVIDQPGIETLEGRIGPLLFGAHVQAHYLDLPPGLYTPEHPHETESIIYTVRGRWVLCSDGKRHIMEPGSLFWFGPNIATGYEVPFDEPAYIIAFKGKMAESAEEMIDYLENKMAPHLEEEHEQGEAFLLAELSEDHPARVFARQVNPASSP